MKKQIVLFIGLLFSTGVNAQNFNTSQEKMDQSRNILGIVNRLAYNKDGKNAPQGSPYLNKVFLPATVNGINASMRYNAYRDEFEFIDAKRDTLVLNKMDQYNSITFATVANQYRLVEFSNKGELTKGYLIALFEKNNFALFKRQAVVLIPEKLAANAYESDRPASYVKAEDTFYFKNGEKGIIEFPSNKKGLIKLFPEKKVEIENFFKQNKIDFDKEADLVKIIDFLAV